uniref:Uncharacterized protein n=1 Tax=Arundo donax TaxID=35708 RepID=A0A0A9GTA8_ARUDO
MCASPLDQEDTQNCSMHGGASHPYICAVIGDIGTIG